MMFDKLVKNQRVVIIVGERDCTASIFVTVGTPRCFAFILFLDIELVKAVE